MLRSILLAAAAVGARGGLFSSSERTCEVESCNTWWTQRLPVADQFVKNEDGAESYGCTVNYIPHHPPELIIKANGREQERISLERFRNPNDIRRLMESKGFARTDAYFKKQQDKRDVEFVAGQEADVYWLDGDGGKHHSGIAEVGAPLVVSTYVGHNFEVQDGFGDPIIMYTVSEKARQRVSIPAETPEL